MSAAAAVACGLVVAPMSLVSPQFGFSLTFIGFVAASIGGLGSLKGGYIGGFAAAFVVQWATLNIGAGWGNTVLFGALLLTYLVRPSGIFGRRLLRQV